MSMEQIRKTRGVPAKRGMRVFYESKQRFGTIKSASGGYLRILLDGDKYAGNYHPTWKLKYLPCEITLTRKLFVCVGCECVYSDFAVSQCDCMQEPPEFIETSFTYTIEAGKDHHGC